MGGDATVKVATRRRKRPTAPPVESQADRAVRLINQLTHTKGPFAGESFNLRPWQEHGIIRPLFKQRKDGLRQYRTCLLMLPRKNGKALAIDTPVATTHGWKAHGDLQAGDFVFGPDGTAVRVLGVTTHYTGPCFTVQFSGGQSIVAHARHEWATDRTWYTGRDRGFRDKRPLPPVETQRIAATLRGGSRGDLVHRVPIAKPLVLPESELPVPPYTFGAWLGDGTTANGSITFADSEIADHIRSEGVPCRPMSQHGQATYYSLSTGERSQKSRDVSIGARLRALGVLGHKHIPTVYKRASRSQRLELLRGIVDTDGHRTSRGQYEVVTVLEELARDIVEVIHSLGMKASMVTDRARLRGVDCGPRHRIQFYRNDDEVAYVQRKRGEPLPTTIKRRSGARTIVSAEACGDHVVNCIQVEGGMYLAGEHLIPTHNSEIAAALAIYFLLFDGEIGAEVYSAAADKDQAALVFNVAAQMIRNDAELLAECEIIDSQKRIVHRKSGSFYRAISAEAYSKHGFNASVVIYDELHAAPNRELWDVLSTSQGARAQPLMIAITTAGYDRHSILWELYSHAKKVQEHPKLDPTFLPILYEAPVDADWTDEAVWHKANPALGDFRSIEEMRTMAARAKEIPAQENTFRRLYLNQWTEQSSRWLAMADWDACVSPVTLEALRGRECFVGLDLSATQDLTAMVAVFPTADGTGFDVLPQFFLPADHLRERGKRDRVPYDEWARHGELTATEGNVVDYEAVRQVLREWGAQFVVRSVAYDPWNATELVTRLQDSDGLTCIPIRQGFGSLAAPTKSVEKSVLSRRLRHSGHPILRWNVSNVAVETDPAGNIKLSKKVSTGRIDGIAALINAVDSMDRHVAIPASVYLTRGVRVLGD
jgi:phage terminase large subunit-like protein